MAEEKKDLEPVQEQQPPETETAEKTENAPEKETETLETALYSWGQALITAVVGVVILFTFIFRLIGVNGPSMQDTLYTGDRLLVINSLLCGEYKQGDVVVARNYNADLNETIVKRIVAVGGQTVDIDFTAGVVYVDGAPLAEPYVKEPTYKPEGTEFPLTLAEDESFSWVTTATAALTAAAAPWAPSTWAISRARRYSC